jgi:hypothetical protein
MQASDGRQFDTGDSEDVLEFDQLAEQLINEPCW